MKKSNFFYFKVSNSGQIEDIKSALSETYGIQKDARKREDANRELNRQVQLLEARLEASKRDKEKALAKGEQPPEIEVHDFRTAGFLPEAVTNFIALLGWNPGDERELFSLDELTQAFTLERISKRPCPDRAPEVEQMFGYAAFAEGFDAAFRSFGDSSASETPHRYESTQTRLVEEFADLENLRLLFAPMEHHE